LEVERKSAGNFFETMPADFQKLGAHLFLLSAHFNSAPADVSKKEERIENTGYKFCRMSNFFGIMPTDFKKLGAHLFLLPAHFKSAGADYKKLVADL
jgi:hypothetical protein